MNCSKSTRLDDVAVDAQPVALDDVAVLRRRGEHDHGDQARARVGANLAQHFHAVHQGELLVEQDHLRVREEATGVGPEAEDELQRLRPVAHHVDIVGEVMLLEGVQRQQFVVRVVLDQQDIDALVGHRRSSFESERKGRALVELGLAPDPAAVTVTMRCTMASPTPVPS